MTIPSENPHGDHQPSLETMLNSLIKTFMVAHVDDSDAHLAQALVFNAARLAWRIREQGLEQDTKSSVSDVVTNADYAAEKFIAGVLTGIRPDDGLLGEEGVQKESSSGRTWVIDPVDGTYNFASGSDYWCSAVALVEGPVSAPDEIIAGAVHRPAMGYTWFAGSGHATSRDSVELPALRETSLEQACVGSYLHPTSLQNPDIRNAWQTVFNNVATLRMLGAGSVDLASVADGTLHAWMQHSVADWDWLPGKALVEGAGGATAKVDAGGVEWSIAGNARTVDEIVTVLKGHTR